MLGVNKICGIENNYNNQNKISFQSKFVPNEVLRNAFDAAKDRAFYKWADDLEDGRAFAKIVEHLLNDGKDDLIKVTKSEKGSTLIINGKRVNYFPVSYGNLSFLNGECVMKNVIDYFSKKMIVDTSKLSNDEFKVIKPTIDKLNADLNADDVLKNPNIYTNLEENMNNIKFALIKNADELLKKLEAKIFNK